jgi:peroxiredoxin Q/BCP
MKRLSASLVALVLFFPVYASAVEVGQKAPEFELASTKGGTIKLADFAGKKEVVLLFYPMDFTPT